MGQRIFRAVTVHGSDEQFGALRNGDAGMIGDVASGFTNIVGVHAVVGGHDGFGDFVGFFGIHDVAVFSLEAGDNFISDRLIGEDVLFGSADHTMVEGFTYNDIMNGFFHVGRSFDESGNVTGANTESRFAGGISSFYKAGAAGGDDRGNVIVVHEGIGPFHAGSGEALNGAVGSAGAGSGVRQYLCRGVDAFYGTGMGREDHGVTGFHAAHGVVNNGGSRVGGGNDGHYNANGAGNVVYLVNGIFVDITGGFHVFDMFIDIFTGEGVFDDFVFVNTVFRFVTGHSGEPFSVGDNGVGHRFNDLIQFFLRECS